MLALALESQENFEIIITNYLLIIFGLELPPDQEDWSFHHVSLSFRISTKVFFTKLQPEQLNPPFLWPADASLSTDAIHDL